jgi:hypothetical protein
MAVTTAVFLARFNEFGNQATATVSACLQQADRETDTTVWGDLHDDATYWLAAHLLALRIREVGMFTGATPAKHYLNGPQVGTDTPFNYSGYSATLYGQEFMRLEQGRLPSTIGFVG